MKKVPSRLDFQMQIYFEKIIKYIFITNIVLFSVESFVFSFFIGQWLSFISSFLSLMQHKKGQKSEQINRYFQPKWKGYFVKKQFANIVHKTHLKYTCIYSIWWLIKGKCFHEKSDRSGGTQKSKFWTFHGVRGTNEISMRLFFLFYQAFGFTIF